MSKTIATDNELKDYMFKLLKENDFDVETVNSFGMNDKNDHQYCSLVCGTSDDENDLICNFEVHENEGKSIIKNIKVW